MTGVGEKKKKEYWSGLPFPSPELVYLRDPLIQGAERTEDSQHGTQKGVHTFSALFQLLYSI